MNTITIHRIIANIIVASFLGKATYNMITTLTNQNSTITEIFIVMMIQTILSWGCINAFLVINKFYSKAFHTRNMNFAKPSLLQNYKLLFVADIYPNLDIIIIQNYHASYIPTRLPPNLTSLTLKNISDLDVLPFTLPLTLKSLQIQRIPITYLPALPSELTSFDLVNTQVKELPNLPQSLTHVRLSPNDWINHPDYINMDRIVDISDINENINDLDINIPDYDDLVDEQYANYTTRVIDYVNKCNKTLGIERVQARMRIINHENILLELYMRKMMHPSRIAALVADESDDVDKVTTQYIESL